MTTTTSNYKIEPTDNDILCGKNVKIYAKHPGNIIYQTYLTQLLDEYQSSNRKKERMKLTARVVQTMKQQHNARFLSDGCSSINRFVRWEILSDQQARDKVSHAFRHKIKRAVKWKTTTSSATFRIVTPESARPLYSAIAPAVSDCSSGTSHVSEFSDPLQAFSPTNCSQPGSRIDSLDQIREPSPLYFKTADIKSKVNFADQHDDVYDDKSIYELKPFSNYSAFDDECVEIMVAYLKTQQVSISTFFCVNADLESSVFGRIDLCVFESMK